MRNTNQTSTRQTVSAGHYPVARTVLLARNVHWTFRLVRNSLGGHCPALTLNIDETNGSHQRKSAFFVLGICLTLLLFGLCGCASSDSGTSGSSGAESGSAETTATSDNSGAADADTSGMDFEYSNRDMDATYDEASATHISLDETTASVEGAGASADGSIVTITEEGCYVVSGTLNDGQLVVETADDVKVQVVLAGVTIHNEDGPAIYIKQTDKCFITLATGSVNTLTDGAEYTLEDGSDEPYATLFSTEDLTINGGGTLDVTSSYRHAICSKDDLVITGGTFVIDAVEDGLRGRDCVKICDGEFTITAGGDGIKSNNDEDTTRGFVGIDGGMFTIDAGDDGIQAYTYLRAVDGTLSITAVDDALHSDGEATIAGGSISIAAGDDAVHAETMLTVDGGSVNVTTCYEGYEAEKIYINGGETHIIATDDALNAASADAVTTSDDASVSTEVSDVTMPENADSFDPGANAPSDTFDGANGATPPSGESANERMQNGGVPQTGMAEGGMGMGDENCLIQINGGYTYLDATGDGVDSNGSVEMTGGVLLVNGPADGGNGAFDYDLTATISGGTVLMVGSTGMAQNFTSGEQPFTFVSASGSAGDNVAITDASGNVLVSLDATKQFGMVIASSASFEEGGEYSLVIGGSLSDANADGFAETGSVSGGATTTCSASVTATSGMGGLGAGGEAMGAGQGGDIQRGRRDMM